MPIIVERTRGFCLSPGSAFVILTTLLLASVVPRGAFAQGSGLGLAIVHRIVTDHGGDVQVSSAAGAGTTVRVRLPVRDADRTEAVERLADRRSA